MDLKRTLIMSQYYQYDVLIIGSGAAGLTTALTLPSHLRIARTE